MSLTQDTHVQVDTTHGKVWTKAWTTSVDGLVIVHDVDHDKWSLTHRASGKAVVELEGGVVNALRFAAHQLRQYDWTVSEGDLTAEQLQAMLMSVTTLLQGAFDKAKGFTPPVMPATERGVGSM